MSRPVLVIGRFGQVAAALQRLAGGSLPGRPLLALGRPILDLAQPDFAQRFQAVLEHYGPALVINAAGYTDVDRAEQESDLARVINGQAVGSMAVVCGERGIPLFHLSTDYVFDGSGTSAWSPDDRTRPLGAYGFSKLLGELKLQQAGGVSGTQALILRVSWIFAAQGRNFLCKILQLATEHPEVRVVADQIGGPTSAESIARALLQLVEPAIANHHPVRGAGEHFPWGVHHLQGRPSVSWCGFAQAIITDAYAIQLIRQVPAVIPITTADFSSLARRPANSLLDCRSARTELGLSEPGWRQDVRHCLAAMAVDHPLL